MLQQKAKQTLLLALWAVLICCVIVGSLLPAKSSVIAAICRLHISLKVLHFCAYTALALIALIAVPRRSNAVLAALAVILLGVALEFGQKLSPGRSCETEPGSLPASQSESLAAVSPRRPVRVDSPDRALASSPSRCSAQKLRPV
jgi:hypothetical protein